jgi:hypothetical protein
MIGTSNIATMKRSLRCTLVPITTLFNNLKSFIGLSVKEI